MNDTIEFVYSLHCGEKFFVKFAANITSDALPSKWLKCEI